MKTYFILFLFSLVRLSAVTATITNTSGAAGVVEFAATPVTTLIPVKDLETITANVPETSTVAFYSPSMVQLATLAVVVESDVWVGVNSGPSIVVKSTGPSFSELVEYFANGFTVVALWELAALALRFLGSLRKPTGEGP